MLGHEPLELGLEDDRHQGDCDEHRDDRLERDCGSTSSSTAPLIPPSSDAMPKRSTLVRCPPARAGSRWRPNRAGDEADRVRHVRRDRRVAEGEQHGKVISVPLPTRVLIAPAAMPAAAMAAISAAPTERRS